MSSLFSIEKGKSNSILRTVSDPVLKIDKHLKKTISKMIKTMKYEKGVGLAAPQVGKNIRLIVCLLNEKSIVMINPIITYTSKETNFDYEGCLSIPEETDKVERFSNITLEYINEKNQKLKANYAMFDARIIQHEIDHLDGILFTDRISKNILTF
jgi:peptide deformylase